MAAGSHGRPRRAPKVGAPLVGLRAWAQGDLPLLERLLGDPLMMQHLGGPETPEKLRSRHERYLTLAGAGADRVYAIVAGAQGEAAGWVGYWESEWQGERIWEVGWSVLPEFQRRGIATTGTALALEQARVAGAHRFMHAFPSVGNAASNAVCRTLGFECAGEVDIEYPPGNPMRCNHWQLDLLGG